jgi:hypothetical protein
MSGVLGVLPDARLTAVRQRRTSAGVAVYFELRSIVTGDLIDGATGLAARYWPPGAAFNDASAFALTPLPVGAGVWLVVVPAVPGASTVQMSTEAPVVQTAEVTVDPAELAPATTTSAREIDTAREAAAIVSGDVAAALVAQEVARLSQTVEESVLPVATLALLHDIAGTREGQRAEVYADPPAPDPDPGNNGIYRWSLADAAWFFNGPSTRTLDARTLLQQQALDTTAALIQPTAPTAPLWSIRSNAGFVLATLRRRAMTALADLSLPGGVVLRGDPDSAQHAAPRGWVEGAISTAFGNIGNSFLPRSGGALTGALTVPGSTFDRGTGGWFRLRSVAGFVVARLDGVGLRLPGGIWRHDGTIVPRAAVLLPRDPVAALEAATRQYVDAQVAAGGGGGGAAAVERVQMCDRCGIPNGANYAGAETNYNLRLPLTASGQTDWSEITVRVANFGMRGWDTPAYTLTSRYAIEYPAGTYHPVWFAGAQRDVVLAPDAVAEALPIPLALPSGAKFWLREYSTITGGPLVMSQEVMQTAEGGGADYGTGVDKTTSGSIPPLYGYAPRTPLAITGRPKVSVI